MNASWQLVLSVTQYAGTGYGGHNTGSTAENAKSYIPGTDANQDSRREQGNWTNRADTGRHRESGYNTGNQGKRQAWSLRMCVWTPLCHALPPTYMFT